MPPQFDAGSPVPLDERGFIAADVPCLGCAYDLRGLAPTGNCPECNAPIASSVSGNLLRLAPVEWLRDLRSGLLLLIIATAGVPALIAFFLFLVPLKQHSEVFAALLSFLLLECIGATGTFLATGTGSAGSTTQLATSSARHSARVAAIVHVGAALIFSVTVLVDPPGQRAPYILLCGSLSLFVLTFGILSSNFLLHLSTLLRRTRATNLAQTAVGVALGMGISTGLATCGGVAVLCLGAPELESFGMCAARLGGLVGAVSFVALFVVLILSIRAVALELRSAAAWQRAEQPGQTDHPRRER